jgi:hypothetical protein
VDKARVVIGWTSSPAAMRPLVVMLCHGSEGVVHQVAIQTYTWTVDVLADQGHRWLQTLSVLGKGVPGMGSSLPLLPFQIHEMIAASLLDHFLPSSLEKFTALFFFGL